MPKVSILMAVNNGEKYIKQSIETILVQTLKDFELIIVNDGSTDHTLDVIKNFKDSRIKVVDLQQNVGLSGALNRGLNYVTSEFVARADADDLYHPERLQKQYDFLTANSEISLVHSLVDYFPDSQRVANSTRYRFFKEYFKPSLDTTTNTKDISEKLYWFCCIIHSVIMIRTKVLIENLYDEKLYIGEDYKLFYTLNKKGYKMATVLEKLIDIRVSSESITALQKQKLFDVLYYIKKEEILNLFNSGYPVYIWGAGSFGVSLYEILNLKSLNISGFIDSDKSKQGFYIKNKKIFNPNILLEQNCKVIVASSIGKFQVAEYLKNLGYNHLNDYLIFD